MFTKDWKKTLGLFSLILLSSVKSVQGAQIEFSDNAQMLNNLPQLQKMLESEFDKNNYIVKISLTELNDRIQSANCGPAQWQIPAGVSLRGKVALVARCRAGGDMALFYQPVEIRLTSRVAVSTRALRFNERVDSDAVRMEERDITHLLTQNDLLDKLDDITGQQTRRGIAQGSILRRDMFEPLPTIRAGDNIRLVISGEGFRLSTEATALQSGQPGQQIRVKTAQGKVLTGAVSAQQFVEMRL